MLKALHDKSQQYTDFTIHFTPKIFKHNFLETACVSLFACKGGKVFAQFGRLMKARFIQQLKHILSRELN
jgi:hypothetical protein